VGGYPKFSSSLADCRRCLANKGINAMNDIVHHSEEEILTFEVSDEALETAAGTGKDKAANYTGMFCSDLSTCPQ
jgi:hypothetical protein